MYKILWLVKSCLWHVFALVSCRQGAADKIQPLPIWKQTWLCPLLSEALPQEEEDCCILTYCKTSTLASSWYS